MMSIVHVNRWAVVVLASLLVVAGCTPARSPGGATSAGQAPAAPAAPRTLTVAAQSELLYIVGRALKSSGNSQTMSNQSFNAGLAYIDEKKVYHPQLAEALPRLNTDTWKVNADGTMETTWRLKPDLVWHDGTALTADAWVFSLKIFSNPDNGTATQLPNRYISEITAPDPRTVVVKWKALFPEADGLTPAQLPPLPRHILDPLVERGDAEVLAASPYWTREFVAAGPYRLTQWEPGAFIEAEAFDRYVFGRPKIDKIRWAFIGDPQVVVANFLSNAVDIGFDNIFRLAQAETLKEQWKPGEGVVLKNLGQTRRLDIQQRPAYVNPQSLLDLRVRKALIHSIDREALNQGLLNGESRVINSFALPSDFFFDDVEKVVARYPFDPRIAGQLLGDVGFTRGVDGVWVHPSYGRFAFEQWTLSNTQNEQELHIVADGLRRQGFDVKEYVVPTAQVQTTEVRSTFPALSATSGGAVEGFTLALTPRPENRWLGGNFGGWPSTPEYERFIDQFNQTLDQTQRYQAYAQAAKIITEDMATIPMLYNPQVLAFRSVLSGPLAPLNAYNIHEWTMK